MKVDKMKLVSYNINGASTVDAQSKIDIILREMPADVWVLAECYEGNEVSEDKEYYWCGSKGKKGLGVVISKELKARRVEVQEELLNYCIPLMAGGCLVVAMWPTRYEETAKIPYPRILMENLLKLEPLLTQQPTIIAGDLNCYVGQSGENKSCNIQSINAWLNQHGLFSAYHKTTGEAIGGESNKTLNYQYREERLFHIDYIFTNVPIKSFDLARWNGADWEGAPIKSDHAPLTVEI